MPLRTSSGKQKTGKQTPSAQRSLPGFLSGIDLAPYKTIRIAVSGDVSLNRLETRCVDTAAFQRLRSIKQLGTTYLVYPTAVHTRFDHSLGVLAMACRMMRAIRGNRSVPLEEREISPEQEQLIRLHALLHDITHVPFGHTIEDECRIFPRHDENRERIEHFLGEESEVGGILTAGLSAELYARLFRLFLAGAGDRDALERLGEDTFILDIITNTVCADLLDYLQRDASFCGIRLDTEYRFLKHLAIRPHEGRRRMIIRLWKEGKATPRRDVLHELIRLLDNRYLMAERAYFHHAKLIAGAMVAGAVARAAIAGEISSGDLLEIGDDVLLDRLARSRDEDVARLAGALGSRRLWKSAFERGREELGAEQKATRDRDVFEDVMRRHHLDAERRTRLEARIAGLLGMESGDFLLHCPHHEMSMKPAGILVFWNGALRPLGDCADDSILGAKLQAILDSHQNLWAVRAFVNPEHLGRRDAVASACDHLFAYEPSRERRFARSFYGAVLDKFLREMHLSREEHERAVEAGTERLLTLPEEDRTATAVRRIAGLG